MNKGKIFVSYSHSDANRASDIVERLSSAKLDVWHDKEISAGRFPDEISRHLWEARFVIVLVSRDAVGRKWIKAEIGKAFELDKSIIPVFLEDVDSQELPIELQGLQQIDATLGLDPLPRILRAVVENVEIEIRQPRFNSVLSLFGASMAFSSALLVLGLAAGGSSMGRMVGMPLADQTSLLLPLEASLLMPDRLTLITRPRRGGFFAMADVLVTTRSLGTMVTSTPQVKKLLRSFDDRSANTGGRQLTDPEGMPIFQTFAVDSYGASREISDSERDKIMQQRCHEMDSLLV